MAASSGDRSASASGSGVGVGCASGRDESACSTPFVSAPSSPARDPSFSAAGCFYSAPASPARGGPGTADEYEYGCELGFDFDFDFSSRCPSPAAAAMSSADELFHNGQIRPMRLASFLLRPQALPPLDGDVPPPPQPPSEQPAPAGAEADERGRLRSRSVHHRRYRSLSPFRARWLPPSSSPAKSVKPAAAGDAEAAPSASRSSSSSSTASSASSSSSSSRSYYRRWGFLKDILHRSKSDGGGGERPPLPSNPSPAPKRSPSPAASRGHGRARRSAHARLYEARRAEAEEMRRRTFLPYRQGLLLGCLGLGSRGYGAMHGLAAAGGGKARP
ncbi:hypothetical protein BDA96_08G140600 [Sorghum bicolor]|jgi:hypothetical protein|uniref:Uncharacterized protein n=2 Tax=Sorghum bicolor TaxID=4558 RepID=A0A921U7I6_SORBI|nr:serine/arginine repetitive matrix protein 2 [Sorghum bicolor]KAG0521199.1 hypothetical protein BDA96_08G140600 [Sorghum bicolor]OQU79303.1 hypothetical protein SORBI_3008G127200 [Sorghum bicolor]|eukprot:XP_002442317.2 serine/arginine repetitive matrix protein 2 [Sorghum bicolor]